jgi:cyanophycin synthetase
MDKNYLKIAGNVHLAYYVEAADILGIKYEIIVPRLTARFEYNGVHWFINNTVIPINSASSTKLARTKNFANKILSSAGVPVPYQEKIISWDELTRFFSKYKQIVLKPAQNLGGKGISILPETMEDLQKAYTYAKEKDRYEGVLAEEYISGTNYRILAIGNKVISVIKRLPAHVTGDGRNTVHQLINLENQRRQERMLMAIPTDQETVHRLRTQSLTMDSIPAVGQYVELRRNANLTTGGTTEECNSIVHPYYIDIAIKTLKALDLEFGGIDLITPDITQPAKCAINEVNYNPGLRLHYKVDKGTVQKVAVPIMEYIRDRYLQIKGDRL